MYAYTLTEKALWDAGAGRERSRMLRVLTTLGCGADGRGWPESLWLTTFGRSSARLSVIGRLPRSWGSSSTARSSAIARKRLQDGQLEPREVIEALEQARAQQADLEAIVARLESLR